MMTCDDLWLVAPPTFTDFLPEEIHIWRVDIDSDTAIDTTNQNPLSEDEVARAGKFHSALDRQRFACTRSALRKILARYISTRPEQIRFIYPANGKPELVLSQNQVGLQFNVSHSGNVGLVGVSLDRIGVDVEQYRSMEFLDIARRYFAASEYRALSELPVQDLQQNFFACWTRKEALLKAIGEGIGTLLKEVAVTVAQHDSPKVLEFQHDPRKVERWSLTDIPVQEGYWAAMAFESRPIRLKHWIFR